MSEVKFHKVVASLPPEAELVANSIYYVRVGQGFDVHVTNSSGLITSYNLNHPVMNQAPINLMPDSGRFSTNQHPLAVDLAEAPYPSSFLAPNNGSVMALAGTFVNNNSTYGGTAGGLSYTVELLLTAMGRTGDAARYGASFYIPEITAGAGTSEPSVGLDDETRYLVTVNPSAAIFTVEQTATLVTWFRGVSGDFHISIPYYLDGTLVPAGTPIPAGSWHHIRILGKSDRGYDRMFPHVYASPGSIMHLAIPAVFHGPVDIGIHLQPIPTINSLIE